MRLFIDTDTASDDAMALLMALKAPDVKVEGVGIVAGNIDFDQEVENALYTIEFSRPKEKVPVYKGCRRPLMREIVTAEYVHGKDGMGESNYPKPTLRPEGMHAVDAMVNKVLEDPGEITVIALGPLTNVAMALVREPEFVSKVRDVYIMGGAVYGNGNITPVAEYNFYVDPEAAHIVFGSGIPATLVGWEVCLSYATLSEEERQEIGLMGTRASKFFLEVTEMLRGHCMKVGFQGTVLPDPLTTAIALDRRIAKRVERRYVGVETRGELTRGMSVVDHTGMSDKVPNINLCYEVDRQKFLEALFDTLRKD